MKVSLVGNPAESWSQRNVLWELRRSKMMLSVLGGLVGLSGTGVQHTINYVKEQYVEELNK
jgi:hypothetical protein